MARMVSAATGYYHCLGLGDKVIAVSEWTIEPSEGALKHILGLPTGMFPDF